jgi:CRISPR-associated endonuclease/helicase Cas3
MSDTIRKSYYAHTKEGRPPVEWQPLEDHLTRVAEQARSFANEFGAGEFGYLAGLWHDLGKYSQEFQKYLSSSGDPTAHIEAKPGRVDHSAAGAQHAFEKSKNGGKLLAYAIAGHHAGLLNGKDNESACLAARLEKLIPVCSPYTSNIENNILSKIMIHCHIADGGAVWTS